MPDLSQVPIRQYQPLDAYNHVVDNGPIDDIAVQILLVNNAVDLMQSVLNASIGTQPDLATRLGISTNPDGTLIASAVDDADHSIEAHTDGDTYVRMLATERSKLSAVAAAATNLSVQIDYAGGPVLYDNGILEFEDSDTIGFRQDGTKIALDILIPLSAAHIHYYDLNPPTLDYLNYLTTGSSTPYMQGSLRVTVNGIRLSQNYAILVPVNGVATALTYVEDVANAVDDIITSGAFALSRTVFPNDIVRIDFDYLA